MKGMNFEEWQALMRAQRNGGPSSQLNNHEAVVAELNENVPKYVGTNFVEGEMYIVIASEDYGSNPLEGYYGKCDLIANSTAIPVLIDKINKNFYLLSRDEHTEVTEVHTDLETGDTTDRDKNYNTQDIDYYIFKNITTHYSELGTVDISINIDGDVFLDQVDASVNGTDYKNYILQYYNGIKLQ